MVALISVVVLGVGILPVVAQTNLPSVFLEQTTPGFVKIWWEPPLEGFRLQVCESVMSEWSNAPSGITNPVVVSSASPTSYYRLAEFFDENLRPYFEFNTDSNQYVLEPWNYNLERNADRSYPLVIFLHGYGGAGNISYLNYLGYDNPDDEKVDEVAWDFQTTNPCFVMIPQTSSFWDNTSLIAQVEAFKLAHRIDTHRIYLIGYSMGGSGSYSFANDYYDYNQHLFAGIIRLSGQSKTSVRDAIAENTGIWLHIGLADDATRIEVTREAYDYLKNYHADAVERSESVAISGVTGTTYILDIDSEDQFLRTEYDGVGHNVYALPFDDPYLMTWLFKQKLSD
jgi:predicted peptidase